MCSEPIKTEVPKSSSWKTYTYDIGCSILSRFSSKLWQAATETFGYGKIPKIPGVMDRVFEVGGVSKAAETLKNFGLDKLIGIDVEKLVTKQITLHDKDIRTFALDFAGCFVFDLFLPDKADDWWKEKRAKFVSTFGDISSDLAYTYANKFVEWNEQKEKEWEAQNPKDPGSESKLSVCMRYIYGEFRCAAQRFSDLVPKRIKLGVVDAVDTVSGSMLGLFNICVGAVANYVVLGCLVDTGTKAFTWQYAIGIMLALKAASFVSDVAKDSAKKFQFLQLKPYFENLVMQDPKIVNELKKISEDPEYATVFIREYLLETIKEAGGKKILYNEQIENFIKEIISRGFAAQKEAELKDNGEVVSRDMMLISM
jgi:hypothetical protein